MYRLSCLCRARPCFQAGDDRIRFLSSVGRRIGMGESGCREGGYIWREMLRVWMGPGVTLVVLETVQKPAAWPHCSL